MLKFSRSNAKLEKLELVIDKVVYSFSLLSGWSCPFAKECLSKVRLIEGRRKLFDGIHTLFRCFSASQEALFPKVFNSRKNNFDILKPLSESEMIEIIVYYLPENADVIRIHVGGDFFSDKYFVAWIKVAILFPNKIFYAYTKSLIYWIRHRELIEETRNFVLTASYGGTQDHLIQSENLRFAKVVFSEKEAENLGLPIDHDDSHAYDPNFRHQSFALLLHGVQPKGSEASKALKALKKLKGKGSYSKRTKINVNV